MELIELEMRIPDALVVHPNALDSQDAILLAEPATIQLIVGHRPQEDEPKERGQQASGQEDNLPWLNRGSRFPAPHCNAVCETATEYLVASLVFI